MTSGERKPSRTLPVLLISAATLAVFLIVFGLSMRGLSGRNGMSGSIELSEVSLQPGDDVYYLTARADITLPDSIRAGLDSGVPLAFILELAFLKPRPYWFDKALLHYEQRFTLTYYELTRHYRVHDQTSDSSRNYRSLSAALSGLGSFERLAVPAPEGTSAHAALSFKLDTQSLPLPLQPLITSSWRLTSEEYLWPVN